MTPEVWGGIECTVNRVGDVFHDQLARSGHAGRLSDLERFAQLGLRTLRYPFLWEHIAPGDLASANWTWVERRWRVLRCLGFEAIVGLVHHGSGPRNTSLLDDSFATGLAAYARAVAQRLPDAAAYTPVNEPCTTARFSALYGHWYPHEQSDRAFVRGILVQCRATVLAMQGIRDINPSARLVQTEDMGRTFSTPPLAYQAEFQNERRWLALDLLCGRVTREHPLWGYLHWAGARTDSIMWFADHPCPPDVIGINYYLTSDRFLDHRVARYPAHLSGGNGRVSYADTEAVRVRPEGLAGHEAILLETFERYRGPLALTEVHTGGTPDEQARWLRDGWTGARAAIARGADVRAVTAWALLGSFDWDTLVTRQTGYYEPGAFDVRDPSLPLTPVGALIQMLTADPERGAACDVGRDPGWWHRVDRLFKRDTALNIARTS